MSFDRIISPEGRYIKYLGSRHKFYIKHGLMPLPKDCRIVLQHGDTANRWAVYHDNFFTQNKDGENTQSSSIRSNRF